MGLVYIHDGQRHLVCLPYSVEGLHRMAEDLGIGRHFFHRRSRGSGRDHPHYDIPARRREELEADPRIGRVSARELHRIIQDGLRGAGEPEGRG